MKFVLLMFAVHFSASWASFIPRSGAYSSGSGSGYYEGVVDDDESLLAQQRVLVDAGEDPFSSPAYDTRPILHECEFDGKNCGWTANHPDAIVYHPKPQMSPEEAQKISLPEKEAQNFWRDYFYVNATKNLPFEFTSPVREATDGIVCVSFSMSASPSTKVELAVQQLNGGPNKTIWTMAQADADRSWQSYQLNVWLSDDYFQLVFNVTSSDGDAYFGMGFVLFQTVVCEREISANEDNYSGTRKIEKLIRKGNKIGSSGSKIVVVGTSAIWPGGIVPYLISAGTFNASMKAMIRAAMLDISNRSCIHFVPRQQATSYIELLNGNGGCYSLVGYSGGYSYVNLSPSSCFDFRIVRHELLHAVGFYHEHQRSDRDSYVDIYWSNFPESVWTQYSAYSSTAVENFGYTYDYESVMHYGTYTFSSSGQPTMRAKYPWARIGAIPTYSATDILEMNKLYSCSSTSVTYGTYCLYDTGSYRCAHYAPCEMGSLTCKSPLYYDSTSESCKTGKNIGESCTSSSTFCSQDNAECSSTTGLCVCSTGYYTGPEGDCLDSGATKRSGQSCTTVFDCMYNLTCDSTTKLCKCPSYMDAVGDYDCQKKVFGSSCSTNTDCSQAISASWCISSVCACPSAFYAITYINEYGQTKQGCQQTSVTRATIGSTCDTTNGYFCAAGLVCRLCPTALSNICTQASQFGDSINQLPDKPPSLYVISSSNRLQLTIKLLPMIIVVILRMALQ